MLGKETMKASARTMVTRNTRPEDGILVGLKGPIAGREYVLVGDSILLGRGTECDIILSDLNVSRRHAKLKIRNGSFTIADQHSKNGIYVNGKQAMHSLLADGDLIGIGESVFRFTVSRNQTGPSRSVRSSRSVSLNKACQPALHFEIRSQGNLLLKKIKWFADLIGSQKPRLKRKQSKKSMSLRRLFIYSAVVFILALSILPMLSSKKVRRDSKIEPTSGQSDVTNRAARIIKKSKPLIKEVATAPKGKQTPAAKTKINLSVARQKYSQAMQAISVQDFKKAIELFALTLELNPNHPVAAKKIEDTDKMLMAKIERHYNQGLREFANLYYNRAVHEWEKVRALSTDYDDMYLKKAEKKIAEAKGKIMEAR